MKTKIFAIIMAVGIALLSVSNAFAMSYPSTLPALPLENATEYDWYVMQYNEQIDLIAINKSDYENLNFTYRPNFYGNGSSAYPMYHYGDNPTTWYRWQLYEDEWVNYRVVNAPSETATYDVEPLYSTRDIFNVETGELVFPLTLPQQIQIVTGGTLEAETMPTVMTTVLPLVACGVGCLALLICLPLFGKVLKRFL